MDEFLPPIARGVAWLALGLSLLVAIRAAYAYRRENRLLRQHIRGLVAGERIRERADLVRLKRFLNERISFDVARKGDRRPFLRESAARTLQTGRGFCGENARVAIRMLRLGGISAHRLYLSGPRWEHVLVEHRWEGGWRLFDGHADPGIAFSDDDVGVIEATDLRRLPNHYERNPWTDCRRINIRSEWPLLRRLSRQRPPGPLAALGESPDLMHAALAFIVFLIAVGTLILVR